MDHLALFVIRPSNWFGVIFDANYAFASVNPGNAPAFGPFVGRNVFGGLSLRYVFG